MTARIGEIALAWAETRLGEVVSYNFYSGRVSSWISGAFERIDVATIYVTSTADESDNALMSSLAESPPSPEIEARLIEGVLLGYPLSETVGCDPSDDVLEHIPLLGMAAKKGYFRLILVAFKMMELRGVGQEKRALYASRALGYSCSIKMLNFLNCFIGNFSLQLDDSKTRNSLKHIAEYGGSEKIAWVINYHAQSLVGEFDGVDTVEGMVREKWGMNWHEVYVFFNNLSMAGADYSLYDYMILCCFDVDLGFDVTFIEGRVVYSLREESITEVNQCLERLIQLFKAMGLSDKEVDTVLSCATRDKKFEALAPIFHRKGIAITFYAQCFLYSYFTVVFDMLKGELGMQSEGELRASL